MKNLLKHGAKFLPNSIYWRLSPLVVGTAAGRVTKKDARYYFEIWMRHYYHLVSKGFEWQSGGAAEIGPGDSLGLGLCLLLSGASRYYAFDLKKYAGLQTNLQVYQDLVELFRGDFSIQIEPVSPESETLVLRPSDIIPNRQLGDYLSTDRLELIYQALANNGGIGGIEISYLTPWNERTEPPVGGLDLIISNAVLEHLDDLDFAYMAFENWLPRYGWMSHEIDFRCHGTANRWNGHWTYSSHQWRQIRGNRPYLLNREPYSAHRILIEGHGFEIVNEVIHRDYSGIRRDQLAVEFSDLSDSDFSTDVVLVQAVKR